MAPLLNSGDYAIAKSLRLEHDIAVGDIVEIDHPDLGPIVKRISELRAGDVRVQGLASTSMDSDQLGRLPRSSVKARLVWCVSPKGLFRLREAGAESSCC